MRTMLLLALVVGIGGGCSETDRGKPIPPPHSSGIESTYRGMTVDLQQRWILRFNGPGDGYRIEGEDARWSAIMVRDPKGRLTDKIWREDRSNEIRSWEQFKLIAETQEGGLVLWRRNCGWSPNGPDAEPPEFQLGTGDGEVPVTIEAPPIGPSEATYLVYVYAGKVWSAAVYGREGHEVHSAHGSPGHWTIGSGYALREKVGPDLGAPPMDEYLMTWCWGPKPEPRLRAAFLIRQFDEGRVFSIVRVEPGRPPSPVSVVRFATRPYDGALSRVESHPLESR